MAGTDWGAVPAFIEELEHFRDERAWAQFHTPRNLAVSLLLEAAEVLEHFQWDEVSEAPADLPAELADVFIYTLLLARRLDVDLLRAARDKLRANAERYPKERAYGRSTKYSRL
ncbi:MAG: nucleotide pyrophosphohydrolase [Chloroflexota bacterium]